MALKSICVDDLLETAKARRKKAEERPGSRDSNILAAEECERLAAEINAISAAAFPRKKVEDIDNFITVNEEASGSREIRQLWSDYTSRVGMQLFPASGVDYLRELLDLANRVISVTPLIPHDSHHR